MELVLVEVVGAGLTAENFVARELASSRSMNTKVRTVTNETVVKPDAWHWDTRAD